jgi:MraZ protein
MVLTRRNVLLFSSNYENKVDIKGRVSLPSQFRSVILNNNSDFQGVAAYQSTKNKPCIEGSRVEKLQQKYDLIENNKDLTDDEKDYYIHVVLGCSVQLPFDTDGRIILPKNLLDFAGIKDKAIFVGLNETFEVWEPSKFVEYTQKAQEQFKNKKISIR